MRVFAVLAACAGLCFAQDLLPRSGSGWEGFKLNSSVKMKRTTTVEGRVPMITIFTTKLAKIETKTLTLETTAKNALGMEQTTKNVVPRTGEAGVGETQKVEKLPGETLRAAGKDFACTRRRITLTGKAGKRVITEWVASSPKVRVKRSEVDYDGRGKVTSTLIMLLSSLGEKRMVGRSKVACLTYKLLHKYGDREESGVAITSREVPGNTVRIDLEARSKGRLLFTARVEALGMQVR